MKLTKRWAAGATIVGLVAITVLLTSRSPHDVDGKVGETSVLAELSEDSLHPSAVEDAFSPGQRDPVGGTDARSIVSDTDPIGVERIWRKIIGVVLSKDGGPIPAAKIQSLTTGDWRKANLSEDINETHRRATVSSELRGDLSGQDGSFSIPNPLPGYVKLQVSAPDYVPVQCVVHVTDSARAVDAGVLILERGVRLSGIVVDANGYGVPDVEFRVPVSVERALYWGSKDVVTRLVGRTTAAGAFLTEAIAPGAWSFMLLSEGHPELTISGDTFEGPNQSLRFTLPVGLEIQGRVLADEEYGVEGLLVSIELSKSQRNLVRGIRGIKKPSVCSADGSFTLRSIPKELENERLSLRIRRAKGPFQELVSDVTASPGERDVRIELAAPFFVQFGVRNAATGEELLAPKLNIDYWTNGAFYGVSHVHSMPRVREDNGAKGRYRIRLTSESNFVYRLHLSPTGFAKYHSIPVHPKAGESLDLGWLEFSPQLIESVRVTDQLNGLPIEDAVVYMIDRQGLNDGPNTPRNFVNGDEGSYYMPSWGITKTDADGLALLPRRLDTEYYLLATHSSYATHELEVISANDPQSTRTVELSHGATLSIHVEEEARGEELTMIKSICEHTSSIYEVLRRIGPPPATTVDANGVAVIEHLAIGQHRFLVVGRHKSIVELDVVDSGFYNRRIDL